MALAGGPLPGTQGLKEAKEAGVTEKQLRLAREKLGVELTKVGYGKGSQWIWALPGQNVPDTPTDTPVVEGDEQNDAF